MRKVTEVRSNETAGPEQDLTDPLPEGVPLIVAEPEATATLDVFASNLPDKAFEGVFDAIRETNWRPIDL